MSNENTEQMMAGYMTLRDYFAAKAMQGLINKIQSNSELGRTAYEVADAMMEARGQHD